MTKTAQNKAGSKVRSRSVTIKTVAEKLALSPSTVSRALRGESSVTPETSQRIVEAAKELGYMRDLRGVNLRTGQTNAICVFLTARPRDEYGDPAIMLLIQGMIDGVAGTDKTVVFRPVASVDQQLDALRTLIASNRFDAFVFDHTEPQDPRVKFLLEADFPFVTFGRTELFTEHAYIDIDNAHAAESATRAMIAKGYKRIALIEPPVQYMFSSQRRQGYMRALEAANMPVDPDLIVETGLGTKTVELGVKKLLSLDTPPDAFVCPNEMTTIAVIRACEQGGLDIAHSGFISRDGTRFFDYFRPAVSSSYYSSYELGEDLSRQVIRRLKGDPVTSLQKLVQTTEIIR